METPSLFAAWVKRRRRTLDLTQEELARRSGYSLAAIRAVERGELRPSKLLAGRLAEALAIEPAQHEDFVRFAREGVPLSEPSVPLPPHPAAAPALAVGFLFLAQGERGLEPAGQAGHLGTQGLQACHQPRLSFWSRSRDSMRSPSSVVV